jgi:NADP-dependent 3-hydroxy acid dehydrogenase YdfG
MDIQSKVALVTGASSGIGEATARLLAKEGVKVGLAARRTERLEQLKKEISDDGGQAVVLEMDVTDQLNVRSGIKLLVKEFGTIDFLINNAGVMPISEVEKLRVEEWHQMVDVNLKGVLNATASAIPYMIAQHSGHIVNISSYAGKKLPKGLRFIRQLNLLFPPLPKG